MTFEITQKMKDAAVKAYADALEAEYAERSYLQQHFFHAIHPLSRNKEFFSKKKLFDFALDLFCISRGLPNRKDARGLDGTDETYQIPGTNIMVNPLSYASDLVFRELNTSDERDAVVLEALLSDTYKDSPDRERALNLCRKIVHHPLSYTSSLNEQYIGVPICATFDYFKGSRNVSDFVRGRISNYQKSKALRNAKP